MQLLLHRNWFAIFLSLIFLTNLYCLSTAYHPQMDGTIEQVNQEIKAYLAICCASHPEEWLTALHTLEFTHNNCQHTDRQKTPFELMFGDLPQLFHTPSRTQGSPR